MKMNLPQRGTALLLCMLLLFSALTPAAGALDNNYIFALTFPDIQCAKHSSDQTYPSSNGAWNNNPVTWQNLSAWINNCCGGRDTVHDVAGNAVYLAKNEREGFQIYFFEQSSSGRSLRVEVSPFVNDDGQILPHTLYKEEYFTAWVNNDYIDPVADALIPYHGEAFDTQCGTNDVIYAQLHAAKDQPAGNYVSEISMYDGEDLLRRETVTAVVWNFALPEGHYASVVCGMYDTASSYTATRGFLELSGIRFDTQGEVLPADCDRAEEILEGWTDFLLDHGVTTLELPRWLIDDDPKAAELAMADPRRKAFAVPLENTDILDQGGRIDYDEPTKEKVLQYKNLAYHNRFLRNKALFHLINEPGWVNDTDVANAFTCRSDAIEAMWPGYHGVSPYKGDGNQTLYLNTLRKDRDIFCLSQEPFCSSSVLRSAYTSGDWFRTWRYPAGNCNGTTFELYQYNKSVVGLYRRNFFWQQNYFGGDGMYYWNCAYMQKENNSRYNPWETMTLPAGDGVSADNGNGILVYPGAPKGLDAATPVPSLRLMQINDGLDDYDYLQLLKEFYAEDSEARQRNYFLNPPALSYGNWECCEVHYDRIRLGNALEAANIRHDFGTWETAVEPDESHDGLQIRTCADCGTQESRPLPLHTHTFSEIEILIEPTCTEPGMESGCCDICGVYTELELPALGHDYVLEDIQYATCTANGFAQYFCSRNNAHTYEKTLPATGHCYTGFFQDRTCTEDGYTTYICEICGDSYIDDVLPAPGHIWDLCYSVGIDAGHERICGECGFTETVPHEWDNYISLGRETGHKCTCADCGVICTEQHNWTWSEAGFVEPTATEPGKEVWNCVDCNESYSEIIPAIGHTHQFSAVITEPTCILPGYTTYACMLCDYRYTDDATSPLGHDFGEWNVTVLPTTTQSGQKTHICTRRGETEWLPVAPSARLSGDCNADGVIDLKDAAQLARFIAGGWGALIRTDNADVNGDGKINLKDITILRRYLAGWDVTLQ